MFEDVANSWTQFFVEDMNKDDEYDVVGDFQNSNTTRRR